MCSIKKKITLPGQDYILENSRYLQVWKRKKNFLISNLNFGRKTMSSIKKELKITLLVENYHCQLVWKRKKNSLLSTWILKVKPRRTCPTKLCDASTQVYGFVIYGVQDGISQIIFAKT